MIDVVHSKHGKSFVGLCAYLMEGAKGEENPDRVAWTSTRNLACKNPMTAARAMAACAMDQARLKENAGLSTRGPKSANHVLHFTLSPGPELAKRMTREDWEQAVDGALAAIGETAGKKGGKNGKRGRTAVRDQFASEHQALIVLHQDTGEEKQHVHVVVNRVHPQHGVMLPTSRDYLKLSRWAQRFQDQHNDHTSAPERRRNNADRDEGRRVYAKKRTPRDIFELEQEARRSHPEAVEISKQQRAKDAALAKESAALRSRCRADWRGMDANHRSRIAGLSEHTAKAINTETRAIHEAFREKRRELELKQNRDADEFHGRERTLLGKARNALSAVTSLRGGANVLWSQGAREAAFDDAQKREQVRIKSEQARLERETRSRLLAEQQRKRVELGHRYRIDRAETILRHQMDKAANRAAWKTRVEERNRAWDDFRERMATRPPTRSYGRQMIEPDEKAQGYLASYKKLLAKRERDRGRGLDDDGGRERD